MYEIEFTPASTEGWEVFMLQFVSARWLAGPFLA